MLGLKLVVFERFAFHFLGFSAGKIKEDGGSFRFQYTIYAVRRRLFGSQP